MLLSLGGRVIKNVTELIRDQFLRWIKLTNIGKTICTAIGKTLVDSRKSDNRSDDKRYRSSFRKSRAIF